MQVTLFCITCFYFYQYCFKNVRLSHRNITAGMSPVDSVGMYKRRFLVMLLLSKHRKRNLFFEKVYVIFIDISSKQCDFCLY